MSSLEQPATQSSLEVVTPMCTLLGMVLSRVPDAVLRSKFAPSSQIMCTICEQQHEEAATLKAALHCLSQITAALDPHDWPAAARPFTTLLSFCTDSRPKVRKRAQSGLVDVLAAIQSTPALAQASDAIVRVCQVVLPGPEAAARAAAAASNKRRHEAEGAIAKAVADALHLLGALKQTIQLLTGSAISSICSLVLKLYILRQPLLSCHATDVLLTLAASSSSHVGAPALADVLSAVLEQESAWDRKDAEVMMSLTRLLEAGFIWLHDLDAAMCTTRLPRVFHTLVAQLSADQDGVRFATSQCLKNLINDCIHPDVIKGAVSLVGMPAGTLSPLQSIAAAVASALGAQHESAWPHALPVVGELFDKLGRPGAPLAEGLLLRLGELCAGAAEAEEDESAATAECAPAAAAAIGCALRSLGPEAVLAVLPLNLQEGLDGQADARTWMLPFLRQHVRGARLDFWGRHLAPIARALGSRAAQAAAVAARRMEALQCRALELQIWATLPSFCSWAEDTAEAFRLYAKEIGAAFQARADLQASICQALQRLCLQNRRAAKVAGVAEGVGFSEPPGAPDEDEDGEAEGDAPGQPADIPSDYTVEVAQRNLAIMRGFAKNWMPLLFSAFVAAEATERTCLADTIAAYAAIADAQTVSAFFRTVIKKLIKVAEDEKAEVPPPDMVREGGDTPSARRCTFLELALCLAPGLDTSGIDVLYKAAKPCLQERDQAVQKKAYRVLAYICEQRPDFLQPKFGDMVELLLAGMATSLSAAKRYRLRCLKAAILAIETGQAPEFEAVDEDGSLTQDQKRQQVVATMVSEIILCVKEVNKKTRIAAYELLIELAHAMHDANPPSLVMDDDAAMEGGVASFKLGGLHTLFTMVLGGLVGATPHMVSASVMGLARLLHEFAPSLQHIVPELLPAVLMLLRTKSREVVKAVLGFVKVVAMRLPAEDLERHLGAILEGILLWSADSKNKFRLKVRVVVERLARRCGYDAVADKIPEGDRKLLTHIRRERLRKEKKQDDLASQMDALEVDGAKSHATKARTARRSEWAHTDVFSDGEDDAADTRSAKSAKTCRTGRPGQPAGGRGQADRRSRQGEAKQAQRRLPGGAGDDDPMDLLDAGTSRQLVRSAAGKAPRDEVMDDFERGEGGRMIIREEKVKAKRKRGGGLDDRASDDSDFDDLRGIAGAKEALRAGGAKTVRFAASVAGSEGGRTLGARSQARSSAARSLGAKSRGSQHSGDRFKAKGTGGDVKGSSKVEPYAYWPLDRKMLNRRPSKKAAAQKGLENIVGAAKAGAKQGRKGHKRQRT
ncbi:hypothetical protein WJX72_011834 [[Myrmecia] bisecta]|uniref:Ribosomal RNA-processing protein 12-like conserved domain-containing protein n=1 Tax=[Myrmecia] bisecta TaxID=41462 RepID=A0AAW1QC78_9CHLO